MALTSSDLKPKHPKHPNLKNWQIERIIVDTRETLAYSFASVLFKNDILTLPGIKYKALKTGDYSLEGFENQITIERKELSDLFGSTGRNRARFQREFERMSEFEYAALMIEGSLSTIFKHPPEYTQMNSKSVYRTLVSWSVKYNVAVWPCPDRVFAEKTTFLLLQNFSIKKYLQTQ